MTYKPEAIGFDGTNGLKRSSPLTGLSDGKEGTLSFWLWHNDPQGETQRILSGGPGGASRFNLQMTAADKINIKVRDSGANVAASWSTGTSVQKQTAEHYLLSWKVDSAIVRAYRNDVDDLGSSDPIVDVDIDYTVADWAVGQFHGSDILFLNARVSDLWFDPVFLDPATTANRRKFISADGNPVPLGTDGSLPTGNAPIIYMREGNPDEGNNAGTGGDFTQNGTFSFVHGPVIRWVGLHDTSGEVA